MVTSQYYDHLPLTYLIRIRCHHTEGHHTASMTRGDLNQPVQTGPSILCMHMAQVTLHVMPDFRFIYIHCFIFALIFTFVPVTVFLFMFLIFCRKFPQNRFDPGTTGILLV